MARTEPGVRIWPAFVGGLGTLALWAVGFVPILGMFTFLLVPSAILLTLAILVAGFSGPNPNVRFLVGCGLVVLVAAAGIVSRSVDRLRAHDFYAVQTTFSSPLEVPFGTPVQVTLDGGRNVTSAGELRYSDITARTPGPVCEGNSELGCSRTVALKWASDVAWDQPHKAVGRLGLRAVASAAPIVFSTVVNEEGHSLTVTTELRKDEVLIAQSIRRLPAEDPGPGSEIELWFWHVLENNLPALILGPSAERIPRLLFKDFLSRAFVVLPEPMPESTPAEVLSESTFEPPQVKSSREVLGLLKSTDCAVRDFSETGYGYNVHSLWDKPGKTVASIPTHADTALCLRDAFYTFGPVADDTFMIERYNFDGTRRWRHAVRFSNAFGYTVTLPRSTLKEEGGRVSATLNIYEKQMGDVRGRREFLDTVLLRRTISFGFATPVEPKTD